ncbi:sugar ABC transporter substrate-binding protein [Microbacterium sp. X-17]|uniref:sugar ABC transporter substrate-binding protein n=1 Tax=Microbacterium sp. X-17 TaxID=3144404 RepID=UPI0031F4A150
MKTAHRAVAVLAAAAIVPLGLVACSSGSGGASTAKSITLEDYYTDGSHDAQYAKCEASTGIKVNAVHVAGASLIQKVLQQVSSKTLPDVLMLDNPDVQQIAATGALAPLKDFGITGDGLTPAAVKAGTYKGQLYGAQPLANSIALFYNTDILQAAGVQPPKTWDELRTAARQLTDASKGRYGFAMSNINTYEGTWQFLPFFWSNGGNEKNIATPQAAQALQFVLDLQNDGSLSKSSISWAQADVNNQFIAGKAAMMINGPWQIPALDKASGLHWASVSIPVREASQTSVAPLGGEQYTVPQTGKKDAQAAGAKFVQCLMSPAMQSFEAKTAQTVPTDLAEAKKFGSANPDVASFVGVVANARSRTAELGEGWPKAATKIYTAVQLALTGKASPADALKQAQSENQ